MISFLYLFFFIAVWLLLGTFIITILSTKQVVEQNANLLLQAILVLIALTVFHTYFAAKLVG